MLAVLSRLARAIGRIVSGLAQINTSINRNARLLVLMLTLVGLALDEQFAKQLREEAWPWLQAHGLTVLSWLLLLGAVRALYERERDHDARSKVKLLAKEAKPDLRERLDGVQDVLIIAVEIGFLNTAETPRRLSFPHLELQQCEKSPMGQKRWVQFPLGSFSPHHRQVQTHMTLKGVLTPNARWQHDVYHDLPALDKRVATFQMLGTVQGGGPAIVGRKLRLKVGVEIIGQERPSVLYLPVTVTGYTT